MKPIIIINGVDFTRLVKECKPSSNDLDADGSGRNILTGLMHRKRVSTKKKYTLTFVRLSSANMSKLLKALYSTTDYVRMTTLDSKTNKRVTRSYYTSTIDEGIQRYIGGDTVYDDVTFDITER